jgi:type IV pilus assembly protein PilE
MKRFKKGFTLIELLVVIAIIGILSSVVLASLNTARGKGADASVKSNLSNVRAQAEILYDNNGCYSNTSTCSTGATVSSCSAANTIFVNTNVSAQITAAQTSGGGTAVCNTSAGATAWAASTQLKTTNVINSSSGTDYWCVDSAGASKIEDAALGATATACL